MAYSATEPTFIQRTAADGINVGNTIVLNSTGNKNPISLMSEMKGGLHYVEYLEYLNENTYRGVSFGRREIGMLVYVQKKWDGGADALWGKYYKLSTLAADGTATWDVLNLSGTDVTPNNTYPVADIAARNALAGLVKGDIVIVANASGDATIVPALTGGATYIFTSVNATPWLRFLYPDDPRLGNSHVQNTDVALVVPLAGGNVNLTSNVIYTHLNDATTHFPINDANLTGSTGEVYSSLKTKTTFLAKNPSGDPAKFFNELGVAVTVQTTLVRINGGTASTVFPA